MMEDEAEDFTMHQEPISQYLEIMSVLQKYGSIALHEDYQNWKENDFHCEVGKPLFIDQADYQTQHIFFDDHASPGEDCIVDVRDVITQETVPYEKFINKYVVKVEPHRACLEVDYFIRQIEMAEQSRDEEIERVESGQPDHDEAVTDRQVQNEYEFL